MLNFLYLFIKYIIKKALEHILNWLKAKISQNENNKISSKDVLIKRFRFKFSSFDRVKRIDELWAWLLY